MVMSYEFMSWGMGVWGERFYRLFPPPGKFSSLKKHSTINAQ